MRKSISIPQGIPTALGTNRRQRLAITALAMLGVCSGASAVQADTIPDTLQKIRSTGTIVIGHRLSEPPFSYVVDGKPAGYSTELCGEIVSLLAKELGMQSISITYVPVSSATRFVMIRAGKIDMECAATTNNAERRKLVAYSYPHFVTATRFVALKSSKAHTLADLAGKSVAATTGTVNLDQLNAVNRERGLNISVLLNKENSGSFDMVTSGKASAFVMDDILLAGQIAAAAKPEEYQISEDALSRPEPYGILLPLGDETFKQAVNGAIKSIYSTGDIYRLYAKWFEQPIPPKGQNMKLPLSQELKSVFDDPKEYQD